MCDEGRHLILQPSQHGFLQLVQCIVLQIHVQALHDCCQQTAGADSDILVNRRGEQNQVCDEVLDEEAARVNFSVRHLGSEGRDEAKGTLNVSVRILQQQCSGISADSSF